MSKQAIHLFAVTISLIGLVLVVSLANRQGLVASQQEFDRASLREFIAAGSYDNDLVLDTYLIPASG